MAYEIKVGHRDSDNKWHAFLELDSGDAFFDDDHVKHIAVGKVKKRADEFLASQDKVETVIESSKSAFTIPVNNPNIAGIGLASFEDSLGSDAIQLQTLFAGLIEKAKREDLDHRLIAMANTDFERGFMALEKALNTNKG